MYMYTREASFSPMTCEKIACGRFLKYVKKYLVSVLMDLLTRLHGQFVTDLQTSLVSDEA